MNDIIKAINDLKDEQKKTNKLLYLIFERINDSRRESRLRKEGSR